MGLFFEICPDINQKIKISINAYNILTFFLLTLTILYISKYRKFQCFNNLCQLLLIQMKYVELRR